MAKIVILNGIARKNGNTKKPIEAFTDGAKSYDNVVFASPVYFWTITGTLKTVGFNSYMNR